MMGTFSRNYAAKVESVISACEANMDKGQKERPIARTMLNIISIAQHFSTPENGKIFDDDLRGIVDAEIRLPYPAITVNYESLGRKFCVMAAERRRKGNPDLFDVHIFAAAGKGDEWVFMPYYTIAERVTDKHELQAYFFDYDSKPFVPRLDQRDAALRCIQSVLELCEALSCSNVTHEPVEKINPAMNAKRIRQGKLPIYETRVLVINAKDARTNSGNGNGTHSSPRQHLRRGHIRRLPSCNIWVNACVVGMTEAGVINKSYAVCSA